jgi:hypothetical protein
LTLDNFPNSTELGYLIMTMTEKQQTYLLKLINSVHGTKYRFLSQVDQDGIGARVRSVQGMSAEEGSQLIDEYQARKAAAGPSFGACDEQVVEVGDLQDNVLKIIKSKGYSGKRGQASYVASLTWDGEISREFADEDDTDWSEYDSRKRKGDMTLTFRLRPGVYEIQQWGERGYIIADAEGAGYVSQREAYETAWQESQ